MEKKLNRSTAGIRRMLAIYPSNKGSPSSQCERANVAGPNRYLVAG